MWLRQAQPPIIPLHGAWACRRHVLIPPCDFDSAQSPYYLLLHSVPEPVEGTFSLLISVPEPVEGTFSLLISVPERSRRHIISIALKSVCFLEHLWCSFGNSKTQSFQQNLRELCVIKINTNIPHTVASTSSATNSFITRCLSLSKAHSQFSSRCLSLSKAPLFLFY